MPTPTASPGFKLAAGPLAFRAPAAPATGKVTIYNQGTKPLDVVTSTLHLGGNCGTLHVTPSRFSLAPGHHLTAMVTDPVANANLGAKFNAVIHGQKGLGTSGGIAVRFVTGHPVGSAVCAASPKAVPLHTVSAGTPLWVWLVLAAVVLAIVAGIVAVVRRRRRRTAR